MRNFTFTRIYDNTQYNTTGIATQFESGLFDIGYTQSSGAGALGESVFLYKDIAIKEFTITFTSGDTRRAVDNKLLDVRQFFALQAGNNNIWYSLTDTFWNLSNFMFRVTDIEMSSFSQLVIHCEAMFGDFVTETTVDTLNSQTISAGGSTAAASGTWTNSSLLEAFIQYKIVPNTAPAVFNAAKSFVFIATGGRKMNILLGQSGAPSVLYNFTAGKLLIESNRKGLVVPGFGRGVIMNDSNFFTVKPGVTITWNLSALDNPISGGSGFTATLSAVTRQQRSF